MHRLDHRAQGAAGTAVGVRHDCGAVVRHEHTHVADRVVREGPLLGRPGEVTARTVRCTDCAAAQAAQAA
ncbi:hypothetical protein [Streptomyces pactum]|uniref:Uncharacterized protein n=1 Tax=Streptomyces pactum TaxID=68249 RepID=A0A1S6J9U9_9ACTN|nr:hypothetical protein [Streptomyces pactum]AQS68517.1 hypothetical protein B1H29_17670 [Streptomyces pactum]